MRRATSPLSRLVAALAPLIAGPVLAADCPVAADLEDGLVLVEPGTPGERLTRDASGQVISILPNGDGSALETQLMGGIYPLETSNMLAGRQVEGTQVTISYAGADPGLPLGSPGGFPDPATGGIWTTEVTLADPSGADTTPQSYSFGAPQDMAFGPCTFRAILIDVRIGDSDEAVGITQTWLPDLGLSFLTEIRAPGEAPLRFPVSRIDRAAP